MYAFWSLIPSFNCTSWQCQRWWYSWCARLASVFRCVQGGMCLKMSPPPARRTIPEPGSNG